MSGEKIKKEDVHSVPGPITAIFEKKRNLALVLSGGSARGLAHIGVLEVLEKHHVPIDTVVGTSMGAIVGGLYSAGTLKEFKKKIINLSHSKLLSMFISHKIKQGNTNIHSVEPFLKDFTKNKKIEELDLHFSAVATNLKTGKEVILEKGDLLTAILASISIPGVFTPVKIEDMLLVDGGVVDPLPEKYGHLIADKVISVNAMPENYKYKSEEDIFTILSEAVGIMTQEIMNHNRVHNSRNVFVQLDTEKIDHFDFTNVEKLINLGKKAAKKKLPEIINLVQMT
jgi:NTE family protein